MSKHLDLELVDVDGAIRETAEQAGIDRRDLLRKGAIGAGGLVGGAAFFGAISPAEAAISTRRRSKRNDVKILNYALTLEYLEAAFYRQALSNNVAGADVGLARFNRIVSEHETAHVRTLRSVLGRARVSEPDFNFGDTVTDVAMFRATAQVLEDTGVRAYAGQGPNILQKPVVVAALSIHSVEARHAAWIRFLNLAQQDQGSAPKSALPAPATFDKAASERTILRAVTETGFIQS